ncbi:L-aspartate oxidase [Aquibacillus koreensis]|uniref:L-aspartate oxidase n=1 Tax=Aquibacillus koreensis TaxID=279446 RepID=A0A9X4AGK1_9BACI|nr:L-aspartate oxidase [Aquibacillus koreensis]MCT2537972.1 L-aspartate oxidase [Aquibacillus koreensis]MDC3419137.1 L-aspartate oxidase [Aquibacillus koreensis]
MKSIIIIGSGLAALTAATRFSRTYNVIVLTKGKIDNTNSRRAQGGIAATISPHDHWKFHYQDTMVAGCYYNDKQAVKTLVQKGSDYIQQLIDSGLTFDCDSHGQLLLGKEGAHQKRRIIHAGGDATGKVMMDFMKKQINDQVVVKEEHAVLDLIIEDNRCIGVIACKQQKELQTYYADHVILATGGCGGLFQVNSNDSSVVGEGLALAFRAGAEVSDLEFIQFHPTMLYVNKRNYGLVSEAVRGEGAILINNNGHHIMNGVHPLKDLAPRDVVARAIEREISQGHEVYLDISMIDQFENRFPTVTSLCEQAHIDVKEAKIPVAPGAHFLMGGVKTNTVGATSVNGLYAIGEVACSGVHGANRLASNSLLEGIVFSNLLANHLINKDSPPVKKPFTPKQYNLTTPKHRSLPTIEEIQQTMTTCVGIERSEEGLLRAKHWIEQFNFQDYTRSKIEAYTIEQIKTINVLTTCWLIVTSALMRTESRGAHFRSDYPLTDHEHWSKQIIRHVSEFQRQREMIGVAE